MQVIPTPTQGPLTGLSASALEYILLGLTLAYTVVAFYRARAGQSTLLGRALGIVLLAIPFIEDMFRRLRLRKRKT